MIWNIVLTINDFWEIYTSLKFVYSEKATKFYKIFTLLLSVCTTDKSKVKISQNFVVFSECTNFTLRQFFETLPLTCWDWKSRTTTYSLCIEVTSQIMDFNDLSWNPLMKPKSSVPVLLSRFYLDFIQIWSRFYRDSIQILST